MKLGKKVKYFVLFEAVRSIARIFYIAGLTALIPLVPLLLSPHELFGAKYAFGIALGLIFLGFLIVYWFTDSKKVALSALGWMTLVPGMLAVIFSFMGTRRMANFLAGFGKASPLLEGWVETYVPKAWLLAGVYIIIGVGLIYWSEKVRK
jgi:hypothetical protein